MTDHWDPDDFDIDLPDDVHLPQPLADADLDLPEPDLDLPGDLPEPDLDLPGDVPDLPELDEIADQLTGDAVFPPALEVDLPEPVDGFPWIDTATLGTAETTGFLPPLEDVSPHELAAYAGIDIPEGADPWSVLAASDDPATAALAAWWTQGEQ